MKIEIKGRHKVREFNKLFQFEPMRGIGSCMCCGYPGVDWYIGSQRIAITAIHHGKTLRWNVFVGDARFTEEASLKLSQWLIANKIPDHTGTWKEIIEKAKSPK